MSMMSAPGVRKPTAAQEALLVQWRVEALDMMPYMASMLFSFQLVDAPGLQTFACDPQHRLYVDFDFLAQDPAKWTARACAEVLLHECGHLFGNHADRGIDSGAITPAERDDHNVASDCEINDDLADFGCTHIAAIGVLPANIGMPDHLTAEEYYGAIRARRAKRAAQQQRGGSGQQGQGQPGQGSGQGGGSGQQQGQSGSGQGQGQGQQGQGSGSVQGQQGQGSGSGQSQQQGPFRGCGSASGGQSAPCELGDGDGSDGTGEGFAPGSTKAENRRVEIATAASIRQHASKSRGSVPAGMVERAEMVLAPPKVPWRRVLSASIKRAVASKLGDFDADPTRRSRRRHNARMPDGRRIFYPGTFTPVPNLVVVRDTSGSMGPEELSAVTSEVDGIARQAGVRGRDLRILDVDAAVHEVFDYQGAKVMAKITGGGGTDMRVGIAAALELRPRPTAVIVISDGYTPWPTEQTRVPLIICLVGDGAAAIADHTPKWAITVVAD